MKDRYRKLIAELVGTYILVFSGTGAIVIENVSMGGVSHMGVALTFGLVVMSMIYTIGPISGAHINPAVTIAFWVSKRFPTKDLLPYIFVQITGAILASLTLRMLFDGEQYGNLGATLPSGTGTQSFVLECVLTFILMFVIINVATGNKEQGLMAGIAIGGVVAFEAAFAGPICGASMNPARSIGPAIVSGNFEYLALYVVAPIVGAVLAVGCYRLISENNK